MRLALTSGAAPELALEALDQACRARGLDGVEWVVPPTEAPDALLEKIRGSGARVLAVRTLFLDPRFASGFARLSGELEVPVSVAEVPSDEQALRGLAERFAETGGRLLLSHATNLEALLALVERIEKTGLERALGLAWDLRPSTERLEDAGALVFAARELLGLVRLYGGGPEQKDQEGRGVGPLFTELAVSGCAATTVLCPSTEAQRPRWDAWLHSKKLAGCGSKVDARTVALDVRDVEPRDRLETILGTYRSLVPGGTLRLTVDHDPSCMYHTLRATEPEGSFDFELLESGPTTWRAKVTKAEPRSA